MRKGIILAGGSGTRLYPITHSISKQLLPVYDKPMIYYPISTLMFAGIREILIISTPHDTPRFQQLLGDGSNWGLNFQYKVQKKPKGIAQAFIIGKEFIRNENCALILGDNLYYGNELSYLLKKSTTDINCATVFAYKVNEPERYGIIEFDQNNKPTKIVEKPKNPTSRYAITGLYFYDNRIIDFAESLKPSARGELEISDINQMYLEKGDLKVKILSRGVAWLDTGTFDSLISATQFIQTIQKRQGVKIGCLEEIAYRLGYIDVKQVEKIAISLNGNDYGKYLIDVLEEKIQPLGSE